MFWILRRTGAVNFFNSLNNNCSSSKVNNNNGTQDKYVKRPPRKDYGRLSADADDTVSLNHKIDDPFDDLDNFELITAGNGGNAQNGNGNQCTAADCQGNFVNSDLCDLNMCTAATTDSAGNVFKSNTNTPATASTSASGIQRRQKELNETTINRLHAMAMSDDDDYDESLTCNVCDRSFHCHRQLASHQQKKRHFGCGGCDSLFPSLMLLEHHKEEFEHWSDDEIGRRICCRRNRDDYFTDTDSYTSEAESEDLERLL